MVTKALVLKFILAVAQAVAADAERDRLVAVCIQHPKSEACRTKVDEKRMPQPSQAWAEAAAAEIVTDPLFKNEPRTEAVHMLLYAWRESGYQDNAVGDSGHSFCSLGVMAGWGASADDLLKSPLICVRTARKIMRASFRCWPDHPMACYAGGHNSSAAAISDARASLVKQLLVKLPALEATEDGAVTAGP